MSKYLIADLIVEMDPQYNLLSNQAKKYLIDSEKSSDIVINIEKEYTNYYKKSFPHLTSEEIEYILFGESFYQQINNFNGTMLHSSCVVKDNYAYLFSAPSGTGKSTLTNYWCELFKDAYILNDDKPAIIVEDNVYACGTPFSGKVDLSKNTKVEVAVIVFLERSTTPWVKEISKSQAIFEILNQTIRPSDASQTNKLLNVIEQIVSKIKIYKMGCINDISQAQFSYENLKPRKE